MIERLRVVWLEVTDLGRSVAFYRDGLRFQLEPGEAPDASETAVFRAGDLRLGLTERQQRSNGTQPGVRLGVEVSGVDAYHDALVARGVDPSSRPTDDDGTRYFTVHDPDGYCWHFLQSAG